MVSSTDLRCTLSWLPWLIYSTDTTVHYRGLSPPYCSYRTNLLEQLNLLQRLCRLKLTVKLLTLVGALIEFQRLSSGIRQLLRAQSLTLVEDEMMVFTAGTYTDTMSVSYAHFERLLGPTVADLGDPAV